MPTKDITGMRSGRLVAQGPTDKRDSRGSVMWLCLCDCGNETVVCTSNITGEKIKSCGCLHAENPPPILTKHGGSHTKLYGVWSAMIERCRNLKHKYYDRYGGRGIWVCIEWHDFGEFRDWALDNGYRDGLEIDRINNDGPYSPENCRWTTHKKNLRNTWRKIEVDIHGETMPLGAVAEKYGLDYNVIWSRYKRGQRGESLIRGCHG